MKHWITSVVAITIAAGLFGPCAADANDKSAIKDKTVWPGFLGKNRDGRVAGFQPPKVWPKALKRAWRVKVGSGYGSPVVAGGRVYQHARQGEDEVVWCFDLKTGKRLWRKAEPTPFTIAGGGHYHGKGPKSCPAYAKGKVFTLGITGVLIARDAATGKEIWRRGYGKNYKRPHPRWGASTSPIVDGDLIIAHFGTDGGGALIAHDIATGKTVWSQGKVGPSYSSPLVVELHGVRQVIDWNEKTLVGVDVKTGKQLWSVDAPQTMTDQNMPTPVRYKGTILLGAENRGVRCLVPNLNDGKWTVQQRWHQKRVALDMSTAIIHGDSLYGLSHYGRGRIFRLDAKTGKVHWQGPPRTGNHAMFLSVPGHVLALKNNGRLSVIKAGGAAYTTAADYRVSKSPCWAPPVLLREGLLVKDKETLSLWSIPVD